MLFNSLYLTVAIGMLLSSSTILPMARSFYQTAYLLIEQIISRHGVPAELLSDQGAHFLSGLIKEDCEILGVKRLNTIAYHLQTNRLVERFNRT